MKYLISIAMMSVFLLSCVKEPRQRIYIETGGVMGIQVVEKNGLTQDEIKTIRFIVFKDPDTNPRMEFNELFADDVFESGSATGSDGVSKLEVALELGRRVNGPNNKMVIVIANEPASMTSALESATSPAEVASLRLNLAEFVNSDHLSLKTDARMPMTAVKWVDDVYETLAEAKNNPIQVSLERAVARVDVFLKRGADVSNDLKIAFGTKIILKNTYGSGYFVNHTQGVNTFGYVQTVSGGFETKEWTLAIPEAEITDSAPVCSFYTPERSCTSGGNADKLIVEADVITGEGASRSGNLIIAKMTDRDNVEHSVAQIKRNNVYYVTVTIGTNEITCSVQDWNDEDIVSEL